MFPDCSRTSHTHATCSWVKPNEAMVAAAAAAAVATEADAAVAAPLAVPLTSETAVWRPLVAAAALRATMIAVAAAVVAVDVARERVR